ncbi:MAG: hypothetical protein AB1295_00415 [Candidatus Micrarchaeota archaeon]
MELVQSKHYRMYKAGREDFPEHTYIICSDASSGILFRPHIAGKALQDRMEKVAEIFMDAAHELVLKGKKTSEITELVFLAGGLYYQLNHGFKKKFDEAIPQCFLGIKRQRVEGSEGQFTAVATYENFESLPDNATVVIGDTIATGATLQKGVYYLLDAMETKGKTLDNLVVCSLACSVKGAQLMKEIEKRVKRSFPDASVYLLVAEELFHLMPDGTDLRFLYDEAVMPDETRERVLSEYGEHLGKEMKCAVFDWGTRCKNPIKHYHEFLEFVEEIKTKEMDDKALAVIERMDKETKESLAALDRPL